MGAALGTAAISQKICVSKNVCHSVVYDLEGHTALKNAIQAARGRRLTAFNMIFNAMDTYLRRKPDGKKLHDPLALAVALDEDVCELAEVELFAKGSEWGSRL